MKKCLTICFLFFFSINQVYSVIPIDSKASSVSVEEPFWLQLSQDEWLTLTPKEIKAKTGKKLKFKQKLALSISRRAYRKSLKQKAIGGGKNSTHDKTSIASFVLSGLGLVLGLFTTSFIFLSISGFILGFLALSRKGNYETMKGKGYAIAGLLMGLTAFGLITASIILAVP